jgi:hypothetical protein
MLTSACSSRIQANKATAMSGKFTTPNHSAQCVRSCSSLNMATAHPGVMLTWSHAQELLPVSCEMVTGTHKYMDGCPYLPCFAHTWQLNSLSTKAR